MDDGSWKPMFRVFEPVDLVQLDVEHHIGVPAQQTVVGCVKDLEVVRVAAQHDRVRCRARRNGCQVEDGASQVGHLRHLALLQTGHVERLLHLRFQALAIVLSVLGDERGVGLHRNGKRLGHLRSDALRLLEGHPLQVEPDGEDAPHRRIKRCGDAELRVQLSEDLARTPAGAHPACPASAQALRAAQQFAIELSGGSSEPDGTPRSRSAARSRRCPGRACVPVEQVLRTLVIA